MGTYKDNHPGVQRPTRSVQICLKGDLVADWEAAERALNRAREEGRSSDSKEAVGLGELVERVRALEAEMLEHTETWIMRAMPRHRFRALVAEHPPRRDENGDVHPEDRVIGVNHDTLLPALVRASVVTPELDDDDWAWLLDEVLTDRQFGDLADAAWFVNRGEVEVPFSHAASLATRDSEGE